MRNGIPQTRQVRRAVALGDLAKRPVLVGGQMFSLYDRSVMHAFVMPNRGSAGMTQDQLQDMYNRPAAGPPFTPLTTGWSVSWGEFSQMFRSQSAPEQAHIASALVFELSKVETPHVREAVVGHLRNIDADLARRVADGLGMDTLPPAQKAAAAVLDLPPSPALQIIGKMKPTLEGRVVGILIDDGSDAATIKALRKAAETAGATVKLVAPRVGGAPESTGSRD